MAEVEFVGGEYDGRRMAVPDPAPYSLYLPVRPRIDLTSIADGEASLMPPEPLRYERAGIRDDGTDWYRLAGRPSDP